MTRVLQTLRVELEAAIEDAIAVLDLLDGDPDMEPEPLEPSGDEDDQFPISVSPFVKHRSAEGST